ncbi:hypothetical protein EPO66_01135 [bacterium]|nr:MAG: hypothetical protein EPO66_01135 [bacterium]
MKKTLSLLFLSLFLLGIISALPSSIIFAQIPGSSDSGIPTPPVNIIFTTQNTPQIDVETTLILKVTPLEDMHADISCFLPEGIEPVRENGILARPYANRQQHNQGQQPRYRYAIELWVGPLSAGITKEFTFRVKVPDNKRYELLARVEALAKWGVKEEPLVINIE